MLGTLSKDQMTAVIRDIKETLSSIDDSESKERSNKQARVLTEDEELLALLTNCWNTNKLLKIVRMKFQVCCLLRCLNTSLMVLLIGMTNISIVEYLAFNAIAGVLEQLNHFWD